MLRTRTAVAIIAVIATLLLSSLVGGCAPTNKKVDLQIESGSENEVLAPIINNFNTINHVNVQMSYKGSIDIMHDLQGDNPPFDAVFPANTIWITLGDSAHRVKDVKSISTSPVVFGIRKSVAEQLGFVGKQVSVKDILDAIKNKKLTFCMTSASQSNSGFSAYIGFLYALLGNPEVITASDLNKPELKTQIKELFSGVDRSSGSSDWLETLFLKSNYDAMVNYESLIIDTNKQLVAQGKEPLYAIYPYDGLTIEDSPLGYVDKGDPAKEALFQKLQAYLLSADVQKQVEELGRRTGLGNTVTNPDPAVFNPDWGIDTNKVITPLKMPTPEVVMQAITLYQTAFRKPSYTVYCLDFSGSMGENGGEGMVKQAMDLLLDQNKAAQNLLQETPDDVTIVIPFSDHIINTWTVKGNNASDLANLDQEIQNLQANDGTDIYSPVIQGLTLLQQVDVQKYSPAVILMTDGQSNTGKTMADLQNYLKANEQDIPVFAIGFGNADYGQLNSITDATRGTVFEGKQDLVGAFMKAKGYN